MSETADTSQEHHSETTQHMAHQPSNNPLGAFRDILWAAALAFFATKFLTYENADLLWHIAKNLKQGFAYATSLIGVVLVIFTLFEYARQSKGNGSYRDIAIFLIALLTLQFFTATFQAIPNEGHDDNKTTLIAKLSKGLSSTNRLSTVAISDLIASTVDYLEIEYFGSAYLRGNQEYSSRLQKSCLLLMFFFLSVAIVLYHSNQRQLIPPVVGDGLGAVFAGVCAWLCRPSGLVSVFWLALISSTVLIIGYFVVLNLPKTQAQDKTSAPSTSASPKAEGQSKGSQ